MVEYVPKFIRDEDVIDLAALRLVLREAELRQTTELELSSNEDGERHQREFADRKAHDVLGRIAAEACVRLDGEIPSAKHPFLVTRRHSMYALHPDTAEQVIKALEALMESVGPLYRIPTRPRRFTAETKRNSKSD